MRTPQSKQTHRVWSLKNRARLNAQENARAVKNPLRRLIIMAKERAIRKKLPFNMTAFSELVIPVICPVLGIPIVRKGGQRTAQSPSLDRVKPHLGYVPGNVRVISWRANDLKKNATSHELRSIAEYIDANS
jgi:hypothetical protein